MKPCALILLVALFAAGCSNFNNRWKEEPIVSVHDTLSGKWSGAWQSFSGHRGELRAIIVPDQSGAPTTQPGTRLYHATFKAKYGWFNAAEYNVELVSSPTADGETFTGTKDLGALEGGLYHYTGTLRHDDLQCSYKATLDHGTFTLHRSQ